jgi:hypothetical protein
MNPQFLEFHPTASATLSQRLPICGLTTDLHLHITPTHLVITGQDVTTSMPYTPLQISL